MVNDWSEETLADILYGFYADERYARRIAKKIVEARQRKPIENATFELVRDNPRTPCRQGYRNADCISRPQNLTVHGKRCQSPSETWLTPNTMVEKYGVDALRYFLFREVPFGLDGDFSEQALD